jgi:hypothetical protein
MFDGCTTLAEMRERLRWAYGRGSCGKWREGRGGQRACKAAGGLQTSCMKVWSAAAAAYCCLLLTLAAVPPPYSFLQANTCLFSFLPFRRQKIRLLEALEADGFRLNGTVEGD